MKAKSLKSIIVIFILFIIAGIMYGITHNKKDEQQENKDISYQTVDMITNIRLGISNFDSIHPYVTNNQEAIYIDQLIFEPLLSITEDYKVSECLAKEWSRIGDKTYVIKLNENIQWQDGSKFTAEDVKFSVTKLQSQTKSVYYSNVKNIKDVEIVDENTVRIELKQTEPFFEYNLIFPIISSTYLSGEDIYNTPKNNTLIGTGMYKIESNTDRTMVLKKNMNWWQITEKNAKVDTINVNKYSSMGEAYNAFKLGNIDILTTENTNIEENIGTIGYNKKEYYGRRHDFIALNTADNLLSRWEVRKAIACAIDKSSIVTSVFGGKYYIADNPLDYGNWTFDQNSSSAGYNPDQAKQVLIDNGWSYKYGSWQKVEDYKTIKLNINLTVNADNGVQVATADIIKSSLENVGIHVNISKLNKDRFKTALDNRNYGMIITGTNSSLSPSLITYFGSGNLANYQNEEANKLLNELLSITDENKIKEDTNRLLQYIKMMFHI